MSEMFHRNLVSTSSLINPCCLATLTIGYPQPTRPSPCSITHKSTNLAIISSSIILINTADHF